MKNIILIQEIVSRETNIILGWCILAGVAVFIWFGIIKPIKSRGFKGGDIFMSFVALFFLILAYALIFNQNLLP